MLAGCHRPTSNVSFRFSFSVDGKPLVQDTLCYVNERGNLYEVTEIQYFISDVALVRADGREISITSDEGVHYVDADIEPTQHWVPMDDIPIGTYAKLRFVLGLSSRLNKSNHFPNPPENNMSWPMVLGGGYHHLKFNGRWLGTDGVVKPFNAHLGTGQLCDEAGNITGFVDNAFVVELPIKDFELSRHKSSTLVLSMDLNQWFENPFALDWNEVGGSIMQNQDAMWTLVQNGQSVFSVHVE